MLAGLLYQLLQLQMSLLFLRDALYPLCVIESQSNLFGVGVGRCELALELTDLLLRRDHGLAGGKGGLGPEYLACDLPEIVIQGLLCLAGVCAALCPLTVEHGGHVLRGDCIGIAPVFFSLDALLLHGVELLNYLLSGGDALFSFGGIVEV